MNWHTGLAALACIASLPCWAEADTTDEVVTIALPHAQGVHLSAVATWPAAGRAGFAILLLPPAGPTDPDLSLGSGGIYREVARALVSDDVASLRISTRGIPPATGRWLQTSFEDRAMDAAAAYDWLRRRPELAGAAIAVAGISEGGGLAMAVATKRPSVAGIVMLSTPMRSGLTTMRWQRDRLLADSTLTASQRDLVTTESDRMLAAVLAGDRGTLHEVLSGPAGALVLPPYGMVPVDLEERISFALSPWYRSQIGYDVATLVSELHTPVFAAYGLLDWVIDSPISAELLATRLSTTVSRQIHILAERNHLMMPAVTGSPAEYGQLPDLIDVALWKTIGSWLKEQGGGPASWVFPIGNSVSQPVRLSTVPRPAHPDMKVRK